MTHSRQFGKTRVVYIKIKGGNKMRKNLVMVALVLVLMASPVFANQQCNEPAKITVTSLQAQTQGQQQGQLQGQVQGINAPMNNNTGVSVVTDRPLLTTPNITPIELPILLNGRIGDYTTLPKFANPALIPLDYKKDVVVKVLAIYSGSFLSRIRLEDLEKTLIDKAQGLKGNIRYVVQFKDSVTTGGIGGGLSGGSSEQYANGGSTGALAVLPGYHTSTANPQFIIKFYQIQ